MFWAKGWLEIDLQLAKTAEASDGFLDNGLAVAIKGLWFVGDWLR